MENTTPNPTPTTITPPVSVTPKKSNNVKQNIIISLVALVVVGSASRVKNVIRITIFFMIGLYYNL